MKQRTYITILLIAILLGLGCDRRFESKDPIGSLSGRPLAPTQLTAAMGDRTVTLSWGTDPKSDPAVMFRIYSATGTAVDFELFDSSAVSPVTLSGFSLAQDVRLRVTAVNSQGLESSPSQAVTVSPGLLSIVVNSDADFANRTNVQIQITAPPSAGFVTFSEDPLFLSGETPVTVGSQRSFDLSDGDAPKTVYARFLFMDGTESVGEISDDITLDTEAAIDSVYFNPTGQVFARYDTIYFYLATPGDTGGEATVAFPGTTPLELFDDGTEGDVTAEDGLYSLAWLIETGISVDAAEVEGNFIDLAGNVADREFSTDSLTIHTAPPAVDLSPAEAISSFEIALEWSTSSSTDFSSYRLYRDNNSGVDDLSELAESFSLQNAESYTDTVDLDATEYFYRLFVIDNSGLTSGSNVVSATTLVNDPPTAVIVGGALADGTTAQLSWGRSQDNDFESYRVYRAATNSVTNADELISFQDVLTQTTFSDYLPSFLDSAFYRVYVYDRQGASTGSNTVRVVK